MHHHRRGLRRLLALEDDGEPDAGGDPDLDARIDAVLADLERAPMPARRRAMLRYAKKLTRTPDAMARADVEALRAAGFEDADVLAIAEVTAYFAYVNRIADGLGVEVEPWHRAAGG